jgi:hypothetical protein
MECPAQRMFARHRLGLPDVCLNELALRHMAQPAADHFQFAGTPNMRCISKA